MRIVKKSQDGKTTVTMEDKSVFLTKGQNYELVATIYPRNPEIDCLLWTSNDETVATVSEEGRIYARGIGKTIVYARAVDGSGQCAACNVAVRQLDAQKQEEKAQNGSVNRTYADPVDIYTGAHLLSNTLMSLFGGQGLKLTIHYDSLKFRSGVFGKGWWHDFEKHLVYEKNICI